MTRLIAFIYAMLIMTFIELMWHAVTCDPVDWRSLYHIAIGFGVACMVMP